MHLNTSQELYDEYFRALKLPGTPIKTFRIRLFLFKAAEEPYTPEDLAAEAQYLELLTDNEFIRQNSNPFPIGDTDGSSSDISATRNHQDEDAYSVSGMLTPSTNVEAELAWEAGFKAGQEAAMLAASEEHWAMQDDSYQYHATEHADKPALDTAITREYAHDDCSSPPVASIPPPGIPPILTTLIPDGKKVHVAHEDSTAVYNNNKNGLAIAAAVASTTTAPSSVMMNDVDNDPDFQSFFESKYEIKHSTKHNNAIQGAGMVSSSTALSKGPLDNATNYSSKDVDDDVKRRDELKGCNDDDDDDKNVSTGTGPHTQDATFSCMHAETPQPVNPIAISNNDQQGNDDGHQQRQQQQRRHHSTGTFAPGDMMMLSPNTMLPTHISIFGDDLEISAALAAVRRYGSPPAAAANLPSHISEFGGGSNDACMHNGHSPSQGGGGGGGDLINGMRVVKNDTDGDHHQRNALALAAAALLNGGTPLATSNTAANMESVRGLLAAARPGFVTPPAPPDASLLPKHFAGLMDPPNTESALAPQHHHAGSSIRRSPPLDSMLIQVHHIDSSVLTIIAKIGEGSFGEVSLCQCPTFGRVAVKWIKSTKVERWASFWKEAALMSRLNHPNVLRFYGLVTQGDVVVGIMTEFAGSGSLASFLRSANANGTDSGAAVMAGADAGNTFLSLKRRAHLALQAANGMAYLHSQKPPIVHFDVKPDNLLVDGDWSSPGGPVVKVADFGLSVVKANTFCSGVHDLRGTMPYMAPEMITDHKRVTEAADVWSLGVVFWELLTGEVPYADVAPAQLIGALGSGARLRVPEWCEPEWRTLIESCWVHDPTLRPTCRQLAMQLQRIKDSAG